MMVTVHYHLFDAEGELVEQSEADAPLQLLLGYGQAVPKLEEALFGGIAGESKAVKLRPSEAFGPRDANAVLELDRDEFPADIAVGDELEAEGAEGQSVPLKIVDLDAERVVADTNHPLAGQTISLEVKIEAVRPATAAELAQGALRLQQLQGGRAQDPLLPVASLLRHLPQARNSGKSPGSHRPPAGKRGKPS
jgi:FKBP-type peptidyl-prolyl cis-trans isomerase SlyD